MYRTIEDIMNKNQQSGRHFFSPSTMRFFKSKVYRTVYRDEEEAYFITSEKAPHDKRKYSVRRANEDGSIETIVWYQFNQYKMAEKFIQTELLKQ